MVNEERLRHLIKMAQFDTNDGKQCKPMTQYARKDYVSMRLLGSFVTGTICYGLLMGMWGLYATEELLAKLNKFDIQGLVMTAVVPYLVFMFASSLYDLLASRPRCGSLYSLSGAVLREAGEAPLLVPWLTTAVRCKSDWLTAAPFATAFLFPSSDLRDSILTA